MLVKIIIMIMSHIAFHRIIPFFEVCLKPFIARKIQGHTPFSNAMASNGEAYSDDR